MLGLPLGGGTWRPTLSCLDIRHIREAVRIGEQLGKQFQWHPIWNHLSATQIVVQHCNRDNATFIHHLDGSELARAGLKVLHLCADQHGRERNVAKPRYLKDTLREIHTRLVSGGLRDEVTLIAAGGIALAEHMAKAIICGADLVAVDTPLLIALGCRLCGRPHPNNEKGGQIHEECPANIDASGADYAFHRMVNLMGAWHSQLIEVLGAMGIREVRRLRGEVGRAIFMEDIEKEAFGDLVRK